MIYLDYAATTPVDPRVAEKMRQCLTVDGNFGNPTSLHPFGEAARETVEIARAQVASAIHAESSEIIWTSGATESNNLALKGAASLYQRKGNHIITVKTEHKAVLDPCQALEKKGVQVTYLTPDRNGLVSIDQLREACRDETMLISVMQVNNETGVVQNIKEIAAFTASRGILLHVDAAQSMGKTTVDMRHMPVDLMSLSAHKVYGPKGIGALYLRKKPRVRVEPLIHGGGHEQGMRSGTLATHQIVGMGEAFTLAMQNGEEEIKRIQQLRDRFLHQLQSVSRLRCNVDLTQTVPHILSVRFEGMLAEAVLKALPQLAVSTASACVGKGTEGSYVLRAMGFSAEEAKSVVRFSFGRFTTIAEIDTAAQAICAAVNGN